jgi:hypothetical protein
MFVLRMIGKKANGKLKGPFGKILRGILNLGWINIRRTKPLSFTEADPMRGPVPGWHNNSSPKGSKRFTSSKGVGKNGIRQIFQWKVNPIREEDCISGINVKVF